MSNVKGSALGKLKEIVILRHGAAGMERWTSGLMQDDADIVGGLILPNAWYPVKLWNDLVNRYVALFGGGDMQSFRQVADRIAETDLQIFFKVLLKMGSPATVVRRSNSLWERYFDIGVMDSIEVGPNHFQTRLTAPRERDRGPGRVTCTAGVPAWQERAVRSAGGRAVRSVHQLCRFDGAPVCEFDITWS
ncbi:hypothetical protein [Chondromyces crocatus]|uniref:4-vinyl reductase 4VR domain-containing protein n=1 Tax=Chondromyces crocatus TaxID=52 RepID=A0A0K1E5N2_CHOCO|nr:hypothetical protein [Chondromyces crocatus]AKT36144.1 uncharacterized protein CMC5_002580 [Chondromyces crocatus]